MLRAALMLPLSHGRLRLVSVDPEVQPQIELNNAAEPEDMRRLMLATRLAWELVGSRPLERAIAGATRSESESLPITSRAGNGRNASPGELDFMHGWMTSRHEGV